VNASKLSHKVWHFVFYDVLFPVFDNAGVRSVIAMRYYEVYLFACCICHLIVCFLDVMKML
jgi:hypothetical protein